MDRRSGVAYWSWTISSSNFGFWACTRTGWQWMGAFWEGALAGALAAFIGGQLGPQIALPEEIGTVPIGAIVGGVMAL